jgi:hypothetical protein
MPAISLTFCTGTGTAGNGVPPFIQGGIAGVEASFSAPMFSSGGVPAT